MLNQRTPTTISGIKSLATAIRRERGIPHHQALDEAARRAGSENWTHARRSISVAAPLPAHWCEVVVHWHDRQTRTAGAEHLRLPITRPLSELVVQERILRAAYLGGFAKEGTEWLVDRSMRVPSKDGATWQALRAARTLQFMEATGLRPSTSRLRFHPKGRWDLRVPGYDHGTKWFNPHDRTYVLVDEPYGERDSDPERAKWAAQHRRQIIRPSWGGMHNPDGGTVAYLIVEAGVDLTGVCKAVASLEAAQAKWMSSSTIFRAW